MTDRVLVPYDRSEQAELALEYALELFPERGITVIHVIEPFADHTEAAGYDAARYESMVEQAETLLEESLSELPDRDIETDIVYGRPVRQIHEYVEQHPIGHVVIGSHGRDGAKRLLLGSVAEQVVRRSSVPVTVIRHDTETVVAEPEEILVPFDGSDQSRTALSHALEWYPDASVTALYVLYPPNDVSESEHLPSTVEGWSTEKDEHATDVLEGAKDVASEYDQTIETASAQGNPPKTIVEYATEEPVDHVIMGSSGRGGLARLLLGSVAEQVVRRSPVSVTVAR